MVSAASVAWCSAQSRRDFKDIEIVAINDLLEPDYLAYMLKYDSVHGRFQGDIRGRGQQPDRQRQKIRLTAIKDPTELKWGEVGADIVIESTGLFLTMETCEKHLKAGAKKVVQSAPSKDETPMFVYGVNHSKYAGEAIVSAASCTTNYLAPVRQGAARQLRHQARPDDPPFKPPPPRKDRRWSVHPGLARRSWRPGKHHPVLDRCCQGRRQGATGTQQEAHRHDLPCADLGHVRG